MNIRYGLVAGAVLLLTACSSTDDLESEDESAEPRISAEEMYTEAREQFDKHNFKKAIDAFEEIEREYPYSDWSIKAKVMAAYAAYKERDYDKSEAILEQFIKLHPGSESISYAYYLRALTAYDQISDVGRDQKMTVRAKAALEDVIRRFPDSEYAKDARLKLDLVHDHLAGKEMEVGRFYQNRGDYLAAINRFSYVVEHFDTTSHAQEALYRLVETYLTLGIIDEAARNAAVLGYNYPYSKWYVRAYALLKPDSKEEPPQAKDEQSLWQSLRGMM